MLNKRHRKFEIANELDKSQSTISREINRHKILKPYKPINGNFYNCKFFINCKICTQKCKKGLNKKDYKIRIYVEVNQSRFIPVNGNLRKTFFFIHYYHFLFYLEFHST